MPTRTTRTAAVLVVTAAAALLPGGVALADVDGAPQPTPVAQSSLLGDIELLNNLNLCPGVTAGLGLGNVLGILGVGDAAPVTNGGDISCHIDDRDDERTEAGDRTP